MQLFQLILGLEVDRRPMVWLVTRGAEGPGLERNLNSASVWGLARCVDAELGSSLEVVCVDLDAFYAF